MQALQQSPDVIAKVGNSYKKRLKVASRVEMFPKLLDEIQKQQDAVEQAKRWDKSTDEWRNHIKSIAKPKFGGTDSEWGTLHGGSCPPGCRARSSVTVLASSPFKPVAVSAAHALWSSTSRVRASQNP